MTQVKDMIDEKLDFALAEQLGWVNAWDGIRLLWIDGKTNEFRRKVTDWHPSTDPAASLEVQAKAIEVDGVGYVRNLEIAKWEKIMAPLARKEVSVLLTASPRERAEAAYITLQGARE
ncbi:hypothetical protein BSK64_06425 [Paenibacillus odorifer]|uniref:hypothetical protein n=1 Tax=Paenibacillus odorifer TaxID=189426 RepID=UPI00096E6E94|nr:hypothetical protein [Paenibacillus odorifer]OME07886.1 hypothetical protein BSK64_06425 [Paenibacillus odorifer]